MVKENDEILLTQYGINRGSVYVKYDTIFTIYVLKELHKISYEDLNPRMFETLFGVYELECLFAKEFFSVLRKALESGSDSADLSKLVHSNFHLFRKNISSIEICKCLERIFKIEEVGKYEVFLTLI